MIVDGQLHGGIAQGVGQALWEGAVYGDDGQLQSGSMLDYALPHASGLPAFELDETVTLSPVNPLGTKGVGEAGAIASTPAVVNAVIDALSPFGIRHLDMPLTAPQGLARDAGCEGSPGMIPAAFAYDRPATLDEALGCSPARATSRSWPVARASCRCSSCASPARSGSSTSAGSASSAGSGPRPTAGSPSAR